MRDNKDFIQNITLEYFSNKLTQDKINGSKSIKDKINKSDIKFYKKRIIHFTKELLKNEKQDNIHSNIPTNIENIFYNYIYTVIEHFKQEDLTDILQREHNSKNSISNDNSSNMSNMNIPDIELSESEMIEGTIEGLTQSTPSLNEQIPLDINKINDILINHKIDKTINNINNTLDNFVIKNNIETKNFDINSDISNNTNNTNNKLPQIKKIFLKEPEFKYKGMKKEEINKLKEKENKRKLKKEQKEKKENKEKEEK